MSFKILTLRHDFLMKIRTYGLDDQNQPVERMIAQGSEACRDVLRGAYKGEELILASYCPFSLPGPYKEYGPVFVLAKPSSEEIELNKFPLPTGSDEDYLGECFVLRAYDKTEHIVDAKLSSPNVYADELNQLFGNDKVDFVLVRFAAYGCYSFRVERCN